MEVRGARTRQSTRRSHQAADAEESEEKEGVLGAQPQFTSSSTRRNAPEEEKEVPRATPRFGPRPRRSLRSRGVNVREEVGEEKKVEEVEEKQLAVQSATPSSSLYSPREEEARSGRSLRALRRSRTHTLKEDEGALTSESRRVKRSGPRSSRGKEEEVRGRSTGKNAQQDQEEVRPDRSTGTNAQQDQEEVRPDRSTLGPNSPEEGEVEVQGTRAPGAKHNLNQCPRKEEEKEGGNNRSLRSKSRISRDLIMREEEEEVRIPRPLRPKSGTSGNAKVQSATPVNAKSTTGGNSLGEREAGPEPGTTPRPGRSSTSGDGRGREEEKHIQGTGFGRPVAAAPALSAAGGEDEETPRITEATHRTGAGDKVPAVASGHLGKEVWGEEKLVRRSQRLTPIPCPDVADSAPDSDAQQTLPPNRSRPESPPAASYTKEAGEKEKEEDEEWNMVRQLLRLKNQIKQQLLEYKAEVEASKMSPTEECTEDNLIQKIEDLERKMEEMKIELEAKTLALKRIQVAHALEKKLEKKDGDFEPILAIMKSILTVNGSILKAQQLTRDLEEKMLEVKKKRLMFKKAGEEKVLEIKAENKRKKDESSLLNNSPLIIKMKKSLQKEIDTTVIIQNVFQHIVMAAKIDWAADPTLKALILQFEKNLNFI
ncbi:centromere protein H [Antechinus flavipes]|uniref:centromere protein H n=1 Tax=Antechinus flavipes TaxID=38775 RepID=UPI00223659BE|nr:centromere protein H [Antechinus flavipes]